MSEDKNYIVYGDTDSVVGDTKIIVNGNEIEIEKYYDSVGGDFIYRDDFNENYIKSVQGDRTFSVSGDVKLNENNISYVMKHKVKKRFYRLTVNDKSVIITEDHSLVVIRNDKILEISPKFLKEGDIFINI